MTSSALEPWMTHTQLSYLFSPPNWKVYLSSQLKKKNTSTTPHPPLRCFGDIETRLFSKRLNFLSQKLDEAVGNHLLEFSVPRNQKLREKKVTLQRAEDHLLGHGFKHTRMVWFQPLPWPSVTNSVHKKISQLHSSFHHGENHKYPG